MEPKLMLGGALLAVGVLVTLLVTLRGGPRGALAGAEQGAAATDGPGVVQPLQAGATRPPLPAWASCLSARPFRQWAANRARRWASRSFPAASIPQSP